MHNTQTKSRLNTSSSVHSDRCQLQEQGKNDLWVTSRSFLVMQSLVPVWLISSNYRLISSVKTSSTLFRLDEWTHERNA